MAPSEFAPWVEWMWRVSGILVSLLVSLEVSFSNSAGTSVDTRSAVSCPDMSLMAMAV